MRTTHKTLIVAISAALLTSTTLYAQDKDSGSAPPSGSSTSAPLGPGGLEGQTCSGSSGSTCSGTIPDVSTVTSSFEVTGCEGVVLDANAGLDLSHSYVGDLIITLTSPNSTAVELYNGDCGEDNIFAMLDDSAGTPVNDECVDATPTIDGIFKPSELLGTLNGASGNGTWRLQIDDVIGGDDGQLNNWSLDLTCGEPEPRATFAVNKVFADGNPAEVDVTLNCFTGLPLTQTQSISGDQDVVFIVTDFDDGELDCNVVEEAVVGYSAEYNNVIETSSESCEYTDLTFSSSRGCTITNTPIPQAVEVDKDWIIEGSSGEDLDPGYRLRLVCDNEIVEGYEGDPNWSKTLYNSDVNGTANSSYTASVVPNWDGGTQCWVEEDVFDSSVEVHNGCENLLVEIGSGDSCTITNTVFYEGIPTLSNYGLALLTLMMLGLGFVGFRRFS